MQETDGILLNSLSVRVSLQGRVVLGEEWKASKISDPFSRLYFVKEGSGCLLPESGEKVEMRGGNIYLIPAGLTFSYGCTHLEKIYFHVNVTAEDGNDIFFGTNRIGALPLSAGEYAALSERMFCPDYAGIMYVKGVIGKVLAKFGEQFCIRKTIPRYGKLVRSAMQIILQDPRIDWHAKKLAAELYVSESKLRKSFKAETGTSLHEYIEKQVFAKAKSMLAGNVFTVDEISEALGFCDRFYFSKRFVSVFGLTPVLYRKKSSYGKAHLKEQE